MTVEKEKMIAGEYYQSDDKVLTEERGNAKELLRQLNITRYRDEGVYRHLLQELMPDSASDLYVEPPFYCDYGYNIHCGEKVYFNFNCVVLDVCPVRIGANTLIGPGVHIYTATHPLDAQERRKYEYGKPVTIGADCWIGGGAIICPGVTIGDRSVIGAGAVVTKDVPVDSLVAGNPAKIIRKIPNLQPLNCPPKVGRINN